MRHAGLAAPPGSSHSVLRNRQQLAFDGEALDPERDYPAARSMCMACPS